MRIRLLAVCFAGLCLGLAMSSFVQAQTGVSAEKQIIETLIEQIAGLKEAKFVRNGSTYDVLVAVGFLRRKWEAKDSEIKTARDFIEKVASFSGTSGKPYLIRFKDGREVKSRDFLAAKLRKIENSLFNARKNGG